MEIIDQFAYSLGYGIFMVVSSKEFLLGLIFGMAIMLPVRRALK